MSEFNFTDFLAMGGYAKYVWSAWSLTIIGMTLLVIQGLKKRSKLLTTLQQQNQQQKARIARANKNDS